MTINIGWPEGIMILLWIINISFSIVKDADSKNSCGLHTLISIVGTLISFFLLYWGGFFD